MILYFYSTKYFELNWLDVMPPCRPNCGLKYTTRVTSQWARWRPKSAASRLFTQQFIQAQIKENIKAPRHWPLRGEFTGNRWIPRTKSQFRGKCFHLMTSSNTQLTPCWKVSSYGMGTPSDYRRSEVGYWGSFFMHFSPWSGYFPEISYRNSWNGLLSGVVI